MYSFLGIFMIFICDSFSKVGKYIRWSAGGFGLFYN
jgi:hypothetical protein